MACVHASLRVFADVGGVRATRRKQVLRAGYLLPSPPTRACTYSVVMCGCLLWQVLLTGYLEALLHARGLLSGGGGGQKVLTLITPAEPKWRGSQLSLRVRAAPSPTGTPPTAHVAHPHTVRLPSVHR